jgi:hypothetical protein
LNFVAGPKPDRRQAAAGPSLGKLFDIRIQGKLKCNFNNLLSLRNCRPMFIGTAIAQIRDFQIYRRNKATKSA